MDRLAAIARDAGRDDAEAVRLAESLMGPEVGVFLGVDPADALRDADMPVLVLAGERDRSTPPYANLPPLRAALAGNATVRFAIFPDPNHVLQPAEAGTVAEYAKIETTVDPRALAEIADFLRRTLRASGGR